MPAKLVNVAIENRIATVTLDNQPSNTLSAAVIEELDRALGELHSNEAARVIVLTGAGKFFCPGADIKELARLERAQEGRDQAARGQALLNRLEQSDKPVIAAINGVCLGGGLELAMACHIRVAASGVQLGLPEVKLGLIPGYGGTQRLTRIIGPAKAAELILTGEPITSEEALTLGLVNRVVPAADLSAQANALAALVASKSLLAIRAALRAIRAGLDAPLHEGLAREAALFGELCESSDMKEGVAAFLGKRPPTFQDR